VAARLAIISSKWRRVGWQIGATPWRGGARPFEATKRGSARSSPLLPATLLLPFPFSHITPALIMLASFAYLEEAAARLWMSLAAALAPFAITAATVRRRSEDASLEKLSWEM
jgi:VIT1/CCC1 family predicted Fe2+/Mn2+ transporter